VAHSPATTRAKAKPPVSLYSLATPERPERRKGLFGTGIGPDLNLGVGTAIRDVGGAVTGLAGLVQSGLRQSTGVNFSDGFIHGLKTLVVPDDTKKYREADRKLLDTAGKGIVSSLAGTFVSTPLQVVQAGAELATLGKVGNFSGSVNKSIGRALGDEALAPRSAVDLARDRGIIPAIVETAGNVALGAGAAGKVLPGSRVLQAGQTPYRTAARVARERLTQPAQARVAGRPSFLDQDAVTFAAENGLPAPRPVPRDLQVDPAFHQRVADAYEAGVSDPTDPAVVKSYEALVDGTRKQWNFLKKKGVQVEFVDRPESGGTYPNEAALFADLKAGRLRVDRTGSGEQHLMPQFNEVLDTDALGNPITVNDAFRAVHDYFGHSRARNLFDRSGEELAYRLHSQMFSPEARPALATETRGQNSVLNYSRENAARVARGEKSQFPVQKAFLLPDDLIADYDAPRRDPTRAELTRMARERGVDPTGLTRDQLWKAVDPAGFQPPVSRLTRALAGIENRVQGRATLRTVQEQTRQASVARNRASSTPAVRAATTTARDLLVSRGLSRLEADVIVGDEIRSRLDGTKLLEDVWGPQLADPEDVFRSLGLREAHIPADFRSPALEAAIDHAADLFRAELPNDAPDPGLLARSDRLLKKAASEGIGTRIAQEARSAQTQYRSWQSRLMELNREEVMLLRARELATAPNGPGVIRKTIRTIGALADRLEQITDEISRLNAPRDPTPPAAASPFQVGVEAGQASRAAEDVLARTRVLSDEFVRVSGAHDDLERALKNRRAGKDGYPGSDRLFVAREKRLEAARRVSVAAADKIKTQLSEGTLPGQLRKAGLEQEAARLEAAAQSSRKSWSPMLRAVETLRKYAESDPGMADLLAEIPDTLPDILRVATDRGFDPTHVGQFTPEQVHRLVFGAMKLGGPVEVQTAGRTLRPVGTVDRSIEALVAGVIETQAQTRVENVIRWVEQNAARPREAQVPDGWVAWDPVRAGLPDTVPGTADLMIPKSVQGVLSKYTRDYSHWAPQVLTRVTDPWRTLVLTLSPGWYVRNFAGNVLAASAEGVSVRDWARAWSQHRKGDQTFRGQSLTPAGEATLVPHSGLKQAADEGGRVKGVLGEVGRRMRRGNEVVDEIARLAVYEKGKRAGLTEEQALSRAVTALVDYGALSGFEQSIVRAVVPFYAWQKGILKVVMSQALDHPARAGVLMQIGALQKQLVADRLGLDPEDVPDQYRHLLGGRNLRGFNPFADADQLLTPAGIAQSLNPLVELAVRQGLGAPEFFPTDYRLGPTGFPQPDLNVPQELLETLTGTPAGRVLGFQNFRELGTVDRGLSFVGVPPPVDEDDLRSRLLRARKQIRGIPNPETAKASTVFAVPKRRSP